MRICDCCGEKMEEGKLPTLLSDPNNLNIEPETIDLCSQCDDEDGREPHIDSTMKHEDYHDSE